MSYVRTLAEYVGDLSYAGAPAPIRERVRTVLLYNLAMAIAGHDPADPVASAFRTIHDKPGDATLIATGGRRAAADASFVNAALVTARGQNDTHPALVAHIGCIVIPAVLAIAEERRLAGEDALSAILAGYEAVAKIGRGAAVEASREGFRATPVFGLFGAAAAVARALRLTARQTANALSIAANFAGGLLQCWADGTSEWRIQVANASSSGLLAALYAERGIDGAPHALEGPNGFYRAYAGSVPTLDLGGWDITEVTFKAYPGCAFNQAPVHALRMLLRDNGFVAADVERIAVSMHPTDAAYPGVAAHGPFETQAGAIMSGPFMLAATLQDGAPTWRHFTRHWNDPSLLELARGIDVSADPGIARWGCRVDVVTSGGNAFTRRFDGDRAFVLGWEETVELLQPLAREWDLADADTRQAALIRSIGELDRATDVERLMQVCGGA